MNTNDIQVKWNESSEEKPLRKEFFKLFQKCSIPENELLMNLALFIKRQDLSQILFMDELYKQIVNVHGSILEFGVRWGRNLALFTSLRGIYDFVD